MNQEKFEKLRTEYPTFYYNKYDVSCDSENIIITYDFEIENLEKFNPTYKIQKKYITNKDIDKDLFNYLVFHIGLIELVSYFKCTCSPNVIIKAGFIDDNQIKWLKKLYYYGLSEMFYKNGINTTIDDFMHITCTCSGKNNFDVSYKGEGNLIPIGGGKDSIVTLNLLKKYKDINNCFVINPKKVHIECIREANYSDEFVITRTIDKRLLELNKQGFLNGHTPFSALVAFTSYFAAYLQNKKYVVLSNESSSNEPTIPGTNINHQYSKTYEFENDFNNYTKKYFNVDIKYFSLLRCLNEFQIAKLFSEYKNFHKIFRSCNIGSKNDPWTWCANCPKCMFVYIMLSPFLSKDELVDIFGIDMYEKEDMLNTLLDLSGHSASKPFECVGTIGEVRYALSLVINKSKDNLPYLLKYYKDNFDLELDHKYELDFNSENNIDSEFLKLIKRN